MLNRAAIVDQNFVRFCDESATRIDPARRDEPLPDGITPDALRELFESMITSRHLDLIARELRRENLGFYTIGSSGHEPNAVLGRFVRASDPAFLHYRSGALMVERSRQVAGEDPIHKTILGFMAAKSDPISGGRHKVWGSVKTCVIPQTSTIASHLPRAVGAAMAIARAGRMRQDLVVGAHGRIPDDSIVLCNFGDASANHAAATAAFNTADYVAHQNLPLPILFVCEDNGLGISTKTAPNWIRAAFGNRPAMRYFTADGSDLVSCAAAARDAAEYVRATRRPAFLHLRVVRLLGHAGSDVETEYHTVNQIEASESRDPLLAAARLLLERGILTPTQLRETYEGVRRRVAAAAHEHRNEERHTDAAEIMRPLAPYSPDAVAAEAMRVADESARLEAFALDGLPGWLRSAQGPRLPENQPARHLAVLINWALHDLMAKYPEMLAFGEDIARKGGVYHVTANLAARFGVGRVFNTLLDETTILGMAIGAAHLDLLPVPEIQYLAYVHNALDQLRGEACSTQFFSNDQFRNPMVVRIASFAYQKGFGGHFHNDNSIAALRDIPGLIIAAPSRGADAVRMLRTCMALAKVDGRVVAFLEPIALYMVKDLYELADGLWLDAYPEPDSAIPLGEGHVYHEDAADLTIITYGNGVPMSLRAARTLQEDDGVRARVVDLRWLNPLNHLFVAEQARATGRVLIVDEGRRTGGVAEAIAMSLAEHLAEPVPVRRVTGADTYIPLGPAADAVLPSEAAILDTALQLVQATLARRA